MFTSPKRNGWMNGTRRVGLPLSVSVTEPLSFSVGT